ncbi:haloacid dehalogenase type II [Streptomyces sp. NPDC050560]|uniref:haloacid dehalogenase type II n=1 Tax=Streptomyces sp. NPDC050560 TaxID=3365630 RepID=UPI0037AA9CD8
MAGIHGIEVVVFDVLGTLVDETGGLRAEIRALLPTADEATTAALAATWQRYRDNAQRHVGEGGRPYAAADVIDAEAARHTAAVAGLTDQDAIARLATVSRRLPPWPDTTASLDRIAGRLPVVALSNAGRATLLRLSAHAGLRWHTALSAGSVRAYKPAPEVYGIALDAADCPPERVLMVAAHPWDLRGARTSGMRTAYVRHPGANATAAGTDETGGADRWFNGLGELATALTAP